MPEWTTIEIIAVLFLATLIRSAFGFGEALFAVPLLALLMPVEVAAPVAVLVSITVALIVVVQDWREVRVRSAVRLVLPTFAGIPLGLIALKMIPEPIVKAVLALVILAFSTDALLRRHRYELRTDSLAWLFGFVAGVLGGAYGMNGPPLVVYGSLRGWSPKQFRATLQGYFLPASLIGMAGYGLTGLWTAAVTRDFLVSLPAVLLAVFVGRIVNHRLEGRRFLLYIYLLLIAVGFTLLVQSVT